jgi:hypothetical protein
MAEQTPTPGPGASVVRNNLQELAQVLRDADHLEPETQQTLADLVAELSQALEAGQLNSEVTGHLADSTAQLIAGLRQQQRGLLSGARERLQDAAAAAEANAPLVTGLTERLIDVLSNIGI